MLTPHALQAALIAELYTMFLVICGTVYALVMLAALVAVARRERDPKGNDALALKLVAVASVITVVVLGVLLGVSFHTSDAIAAASTHANVTVRVAAKQWWWQFEVVESVPANSVITANELHLPVNEPARFDLETRDVIHSFWVPELTGKRDIIPGQASSLIVTPQRIGRFRGRCAEFCGLQHAHMELVIVVEARPAFDAWLDGQRATPPAPDTDETRHGQEVFLARSCPTCHTIAGIAAMGSNGPTLSHLASRATLAAGTVPNNRGNLTGWIANPQSIKPGAHMPPQPMPPEDLNALVAYLETLR